MQSNQQAQKTESGDWVKVLAKDEATCSVCRMQLSLHLPTLFSASQAGSQIEKLS